MRSIYLLITLATLVSAGPVFAAPALAQSQNQSNATPQAQEQTVVLDVENMTCPSCPITIKKALRAVPGVIDAQADLDTKTATVRFDPRKTNVTALTQATTNAGYPSKPKP